MIELGKTRIIDNKVYFEPDGIEKPKGKSITEFFQAAERFIESKQLIEVENVGKTDKNNWVLINNIYEPYLKIRNNQPCKAGVNGNTCTIIELIKK